MVAVRAAANIVTLQHRLLGKWKLGGVGVAVVDIVLSPQAPSKDAVRDVCVQSHQGPSRRLAESTAATLGIPAAQAAQVRHTQQNFMSSLLLIRGNSRYLIF